MKTPSSSPLTIIITTFLHILAISSTGVFAACDNQPDAPGCTTCFDPTGAWAPSGAYIQDVALATDFTSESCPCPGVWGCDWEIDPNHPFKNGGKPYYQMVLGCNSELCAEFTSWALSFAGPIFHRRVEWCSETISYWHRETGIPYSQGFKTCGWYCDWQVYNVLDLRQWYMTEDFTTAFGGGGRGRWIPGEEVSYSDFRLGETVPLPGAYVAIRGFEYEPDPHWQNNDNYHSLMVNEMWVHEDMLGAIFQIEISLLEGNSSNRVKSSHHYDDILSITPQGSEWIGSDRKIYGFGIALDSDRMPIYDASRLHWETHDYVAKPPEIMPVRAHDLDWDKYGWKVPLLQAYAKQLQEEGGLDIVSSSGYVKVPEIPDGNSIHWYFPQDIPEEVVIHIDLKAVHPLPIKGVEMVWDPGYLPSSYMVQYADADHEFRNAKMPDYQLGQFQPTKTLPAKAEYPPIPVPARFTESSEGTDVRYVRLVFPKDSFKQEAVLLGLRFDYYEIPREDSDHNPGDCLPDTQEHAMQYAQWVSLGKPDCWCNEYGEEGTQGNQCYGDANGDTHSRGYIVYTTDLSRMAISWKARIGDKNLDPCADFAHKSHSRGYVVYTDDLTILSTNWKKKAYDPISEPNGLRGDCPLTDAGMGL